MLLEKNYTVICSSCWELKIFQGFSFYWVSLDSKPFVCWLVGCLFISLKWVKCIFNYFEYPMQIKSCFWLFVSFLRFGNILKVNFTMKSIYGKEVFFLSGINDYSKYFLIKYQENWGNVRQGNKTSVSL